MKHIDIKEDLPYWEEPKKEGKTSKSRGYISIYWKCCHCFSRMYKNKEGTRYEGFCPVCRRPSSAAIGPGGTQQRLFFAE